MVDFSSVSLKIQAPNAPEVLDVLGKIDERGQRVARNIGGAHRESLTLVSRHASMTARKVAGELSMIAAEGKVSAGALKSLATEAGNAALMFGPYGAIAGAVALTGIAIYNMFSRTRDEIEKTAQKARQEIAQLANAGDAAGLTKRMRTLLYGQPFDEEGNLVGPSARVRGAFKGSLADLESEWAATMQRLGSAAVVDPAVNRLSRQLQAKREEFARLREAMLNLQAQPSSQFGLPGVTTKALSDDALKALNDRRNTNGEVLSKLLGGGRPMPNMLGASVAGGLRPDLTEFGFAVRAGIQEALKTVPPLPPTEITPDLERIMAIGPLAEKIQSQLETTLGDAIASGIIAAFQRGANAGTAAAAFGGTILQGLGRIFQMIGAQALAGMAFIAKIATAMATWNPLIGIPAALGLIALGAALQGAGGRMQQNAMPGGYGGAGGYGGGGYGFGGPTAIIDRGLINPLNGAPNMAGVTAQQPFVFAPTIIGTNDARAQTELVRMFEIGLARSGRRI